MILVCKLFNESCLIGRLIIKEFGKNEDYWEEYLSKEIWKFAESFRGSHTCPNHHYFGSILWSTTSMLYLPKFSFSVIVEKLGHIQDLPIECKTNYKHAMQILLFRPRPGSWKYTIQSWEVKLPKREIPRTSLKGFQNGICANWLTKKSGKHLWMY